eukprot:999546-Rhodomonas_salina.2
MNALRFLAAVSAGASKEQQQGTKDVAGEAKQEAPIAEVPGQSLPLLCQGFASKNCATWSEDPEEDTAAVLPSDRFVFLLISSLPRVCRTPTLLSSSLHVVPLPVMSSLRPQGPQLMTGDQLFGRRADKSPQQCLQLSDTPAALCIYGKGRVRQKPWLRNGKGQLAARELYTERRTEKLEPETEEGAFMQHLSPASYWQLHRLARDFSSD